MDTPKDNARARRKIGASFDFLSDTQGSLTDVFGLRHKGGNPENGRDIPRSATVLLDKTRKVRWLHISENYRLRPDASEVLQAVQAALKP